MAKPVPIAPPANPGASATATIYDNGEIPVGFVSEQRRGYSRVRIACYLSHAATLYVKWGAPGSANLRTVNGGGAGEAIAATTYFQRDILLQPGRNQITIVTVTTPTTWEVGVEAVEDQALGQ